MRPHLLLPMAACLIALVAACSRPAPVTTSGAARGQTPASSASAATAAALAPLPPSTARAEPVVIPQWTGKQAPEFYLALLNGEPLSLAELRGRPVVINFWASWCPPCRAEMPALERAWQKHRDQVSFIGIALWDTEPAAVEAVEKLQVTYPVGLDRDSRIAKAYQVTALPSTYFVDARGVVTKRVATEVTEGALTFFISSLLR